MRKAAILISGALFLLFLLVVAGFRIWLQLPHPSDRLLVDNLRLHQAYYRGLLSAEVGSGSPETAGRVLIEESEREWGDAGERTWSSKGYAYSTEELQPLVESLDGFKSGEWVVAYKKLEGNWYLYYHSSVEKPE